MSIGCACGLAAVAVKTMGAPEARLRLRAWVFWGWGQPTKARLEEGAGGVCKAKEDTGKRPVGVLGRSGVVGLIGRKES